MKETRKLPNAHLALVEQTKIREYLLNPAHRFGASKARFFAEFGFTMDTWETLAVALKKHGAQNEVVGMKETGFGPRYESRERWRRLTEGARAFVRSGR